MELFHSQKWSFSVIPLEKKKRFIQVSREIQSCCSEEEQTFFSTVIHLKVIALSFFDCPQGIYLLHWMFLSTNWDPGVIQIVSYSTIGN